MASTPSAANQGEPPRADDPVVESLPVVKLFPIVVALSLAVFCQALDQTIIATAIPQITTDFNSINDLGWYGSSYLLATCAFQLSYGKLYNLFSPKWVFLGALAMFELGSLVLGITPSSIGFIMGRVLAGIGAGGLFSGALLLIAASVPLEKRAIYSGLFGAIYALASVVGPLLGGAFTQRVTWRLCFLINLPCGLTTAVFVIFFIHQKPETAPRTKPTVKELAANLDVVGLAVFIPIIVCLLLALQWGGTTYKWSNVRVIVLFVLAGLLFIAFVGVQWWQKNRAMVPAAVFQNRTVLTCLFFVFFLYGGFIVLTFYLPIWFQGVRGVSPVQSGLETLPMILGMVLASLFSGGLVTYLGYYTWSCILSSILTSVGAGLLATLTPTTSSGRWIGFQILAGVGLGLGVQMPMIALQAALPQTQVPEGIALMVFTQILGAAVFIQAGQNIFTNRLVHNVLATGIPINIQKILSQGLRNVVDLVSPEDRDKIIFAYNKSITQTFYLPVALSATSLVGAVFIPWLSLKKGPEQKASQEPDQEAVQETVPEKGNTTSSSQMHAPSPE